MVVNGKKVSALTIALLVAVIVLAITSAFFSSRSADFLSFVDSLLTLATYVLSLLGGVVVFFGAALTAVRFVQIKLKDPYQPSGVTRYLSGYLTLGLELFIGSEIIKTTVTRSIPDFEVLVLIILSRGLFSLILYLERRWHGSETGQSE